MRALERPLRRVLRFPVGFAVFFVLFYLYVWLRIDTRLIYFWPTSKFPSFLLGADFFADFLTYPGGLVGYASAFLCQLYYYGWIGALVITVVTALLCLTARAFVASTTGVGPRYLHFVPAVLILVLYNTYVQPLGVVLGLLAATALACLYVRMRLRAAALRFGAFLVLSAFLHYAAGGAILVYGVLCAIFELLRAKRRLLAALCFLSAGVIPYAAGKLVFGLRIGDAYGRLLPFHPDSDLHAGPLALCLYVFFPVAAAGAALWPRAREAVARVFGRALPGRLAAGIELVRRSRLRRLYESVALLALVAVPVWLSFDRGLAGCLRIDYLGRHGRREELLRQARRLPPGYYSIMACCEVNRALYHLGRLPDSMFSYPQLPGGLLMAPPEVVDQFASYPVLFVKFSDVLFELGRINEAEHLAHEAFTHVGMWPPLLQGMALARIIKGEAEAGRVFLNLLARDLIYGGWAADCLRRLEVDPLLSAEEEIRRLRSFMPVEDDVTEPAVEGLLQELLDRNKQNRMAFEYLMAHYLLTRNPEGVVRNIHRLDDFGYKRIPRHYEEAILIYTDRTGNDANLHGRSIGWPTLSRFEEFCKVRDLHSGDQRGAWRALAKDYGDTYFFHYVFGLGAGTP